MTMTSYFLPNITGWEMHVGDYGLTLQTASIGTFGEFKESDQRCAQGMRHLGELLKMGWFRDRKCLPSR